MTLMLENRLFDEIVIGDHAEITRALTLDDIRAFASVTGDLNPAHLDAGYAAASPMHGLVAHGQWAVALIAAVLGTRLPGPGTLFVRQHFDFLAPARPGDTLTARVNVTARESMHKHLTLACACNNQRGELLLRGEVEVSAPRLKLRMPAADLPQVMVQAHAGYGRLLAAAKRQPPLRVAVAHPCSTEALEGAIEAWREGLIVPLLVGPTARIRALAQAAGLDLSVFEVVDTPHSHASARSAVALVRAGRAAALMKGSLHTDELLHAVLDKDLGLRSERRLSHAFVLDVPGYPRPLLLSDAAINIYPTLADKRDIVQNAIDLAHRIGIATPRVALLSAVETVSPAIASTMDAAALCKMAERGQISGGVLDGPLAFDNAISPDAVRIKGIVSPVAGQADVLIVPDMESGNMLYKQLTFMADADAAGVVLGARVPIMLTSRADGVRNRLASAALAVLLGNRAADASAQTASATMPEAVH